MFVNPAAGWFHSHQYQAGSECEHCGAIVRHEPWCITCDALVRYAYEVVSDAGKLTLIDRLTLHALGVAWQDASQGGNNNQNPRPCKNER